VTKGGEQKKGQLRERKKKIISIVFLNVGKGKNLQKKKIKEGGKRGENTFTPVRGTKRRCRKSFNWKRRKEVISLTDHFKKGVR